MKKTNTLYKRIRKTFAVIIAKSLRALCHGLHSGGTNIPGHAARIIDPQILSELSSEVRTIIITGSNGKTTAVHAAAHMLNALQIQCAYSRNGENMENSLLTVLIDNYDLGKKRPVNDIAVLECDEKYLIKLLWAIKPVCITITNICKNQTDRLGLPEDVVEMFHEGLSDYQGIICMNAADKYSKQLAEKLSSQKRIEYSVSGNNIFIAGNPFQVKLGIPGEYNTGNAAAAMASLYAVGLLSGTAVDSLQTLQPVFGRMEKIEIGSTPVIMNLAKNPAGVYESVQYITENFNSTRWVLGFDNDLKDGKDLSWISDVPWKDYEKHFTEVIVFTDLCDETEKTLRSMDIPFRSTKNVRHLIEMIKESREPVYMILNYTCMMKVRKEMARQKYVLDYWK